MNAPILAPDVPVPPSPPPSWFDTIKNNGTMIGLAGVIAFLVWTNWPAVRPPDPLPPTPTLELVAPDKIEVGKPFLVTYTAGSIPEWLDPQLDGMFVHHGRDSKDGATYTGSEGIVISKPGTFSIGAAVIEHGTIVQRWKVLVASGIGPQPPPNPVDPPKPPTPVVPDPPAPPIPAAGFRVLVVYETATLNSLPPPQLTILAAKSVRDYLNLRCVTETDGKKGWRFVDKDIAPSGLPANLKMAFGRPRASIPWIVISNGVAGFEGPLPANTDAALELLKKFGGV